MSSHTKRIVGYALTGLVVLGLVVLVVSGFKEFNRWQKRADANNRVKVTAINIRNAEQAALVVHAQNATVEARADQRLIEAKGIRHAQDEISATLTDKYLQHEAIKAQMLMAGSPSHSTVYIPSGEMGLPLVATVPPPETESK